MSYFLKQKNPQSDVASDCTEAPDFKNGRSTAEVGTCYEVFRNNTTAVEIVVKEVHNKCNSKTDAKTNLRNAKKLQEDVDRLKFELEKANAALLKSRRGFKIIIVEMKKQLEIVNQNEIEIQKEKLVLQLENEKLRTLLDSKTNLISKFKRELSNMKRLLKLAMKSITSLPQMTEMLPVTSDADYDEFENDLKKNIDIKFATKIYESMGTTFDSTISKDATDSFDIKRF